MADSNDKVEELEPDSQARIAMTGNGGRRPANGARRFARGLLWPARRFFDPRFVGVHEAVQDIRRLIEADMNAANEIATFQGRTIDGILGQLEHQDRELTRIQTNIEELTRFVTFDPGASHPVEELTAPMARLLTFEASHEGFSSQSGLWFNPPVSVGYAQGDVHVQWVNERVAEPPYVYRALGAVEPGSTVLDVGATESTVCLSLATLGYRVTAIDPRPNPLSHERLEVVVGRVEDWDTDARFNAIVCLSTIEHLGTGAYEQEAATERRVDLEAMKRLHELTRYRGLLVLTTAVGKPSVNEFGRVYDRVGLDQLLEGWEVADLTLVQRRDPTTWVTIDEPIEALKPDAETVAMVTATKTV